MSAVRRAAWLVALLLALPPAAAAEPVRVLAAFTLKPALDRIAEGYRREGGAVTLVYGASPTLAEEVENGLQADLFFSADPMWTDQLAQRRLVKPGGIVDLVGNHLVLIGRKGTAPAALRRGFALARLVGAGPLVMCDPDSHPAGRMAKASLSALGLWDGVSAKVARAENPLLAVKMVARGDAPFAVVFTTDAMSDPGVAIVGTFPDDSHPPIRDPVAVLAGSTNPDAQRFLQYLKSPGSIAIFNRLGYVATAAR